MNIYRAHDVVGQWLAGEHAYQFAGPVVMDYDSIDERLARIMELEMPERWHSQLLYRQHPSDSATMRHASQQVLKVCAAARAAFIYSDVLDGGGFADANLRSWQVVEAALHDEGAMDHFQARLYGPFPQAIGTWEYLADNRREVVEPGLIRAVGLAAANLYEVELVTGGEVLPEPGLPSGKLHDWLAPEQHRLPS